MEFIEYEAECEDYSSDQSYVSTDRDDEDHSSFIDDSESVRLNDPISLYAKNVQKTQKKTHNLFNMVETSWAVKFIRFLKPLSFWHTLERAF